MCVAISYPTAMFQYPTQDFLGLQKVDQRLDRSIYEGPLICRPTNCHAIAEQEHHNYPAPVDGVYKEDQTAISRKKKERERES